MQAPKQTTTYIRQKKSYLNTTLNKCAKLVKFHRPRARECTDLLSYSHILLKVLHNVFHKSCLMCYVDSPGGVGCHGNH